MNDQQKRIPAENVPRVPGKSIGKWLMNRHPLERRAIGIRDDILFVR